ncbi:MAG: amino acid ABC transporter substrate-binding protein [bacterium]|nr:amino acid ABC transporter substrate-binding protein [bacterium]
MAVILTRSSLGKIVALGGVVLLLAASLFAFSGCASSKPGDVNSGLELSGSKLEQAEGLYADLHREISLHRYRKSLELAGTLLDYYPAFDRNDEVLVLAMDAATHLEDLPRAQGLGNELLARYPQSPLVDQALLKESELALAQADTFSGVVYLLRYHNRNPMRSTLANGLPRSDSLLQRLTASELGQLKAEQEDKPLWSYLAFLQTSSFLDDGLYPQAEEIVAEMRFVDQDEKWTLAAMDLLSGKGLAADGVTRRPTIGNINMDQVGVLSPLTGRFAVLGNAFYDGAILALNAANEETGREFILKVEDTAGDPVTAALAARRLSSEDGCGSLFGSLMSDPTAATAIVADIYGVPLVSPTATNDRVWELGDGIFQTNLTGLHEVRLLAQLATTILLKERFAILHENTPEGQRKAQVFAQEVEKFGGNVVSIEPYNLADTDFRKAILAMKKQRPEVIFTPATVDQMIMLAPQLDFYKAGALVMGLSNWNSERLFSRTNTVLERAIFPSDLALFPTLWTGEFNAGWDGKNYPKEARALALKSYQAMRLILDTLHQSGATNRDQLQEALERRLANRDIMAEGPDSFATTVRLYSNERPRPFPSGIFAESWALTDGAVVDSLSVMSPDSLENLQNMDLVPETEGLPE